MFWQNETPGEKCPVLYGNHVCYRDVQPPGELCAATGGCCTPGALSLVLFKESAPDPERKTACYRIPRPCNHTAGYRIPQGRTDMRFRATQLGRRLQRGHTLQRRCYVAAHSTQGTSRTPPPTKRLRGTAKLYSPPVSGTRSESAVGDAQVPSD